MTIRWPFWWFRSAPLQRQRYSLLTWEQTAEWKKIRDGNKNGHFVWEVDDKGDGDADDPNGLDPEDTKWETYEYSTGQEEERGGCGYLVPSSKSDSSGLTIVHN